MTRAQEKAETLAFLGDPSIEGADPKAVARLMRGILPPMSTLPRMSVPCRVCGKVMPSYDWSRHAGWTGKECAGRPVEARKPKTQAKTRAKRQNALNRTLDPLRWPNLARFDAEMAARAA